MLVPPRTDASNPQELTPPFVPRLTVLRVVMRTGSRGDRTPLSEDQVSPQQHA